jgi:hypothetical protein
MWTLFFMSILQHTVPKIQFMYSQKLRGFVPNSYIHVSVSD